MTALAPVDLHKFAESLEGDPRLVHVERIPARAATFGELDHPLPEAVRDAALDPDLASLPDGIQTVVGERGIVLSGGQRQRVALARGLAYGARGTDRLLLFDDVLSAVDHHTEQLLIHTLLGRGASRPTCILVTHRMSALQHCDRVVVLDAGRIVQSGTHTELLAAPGVYKEAWDTQQGSGEVA